MSKIDEDINLKSYACDNKEEYIKYLTYKNEKDVYIDPDTTYNLKNHLFYTNLIAFLNAREDWFCQKKGVKGGAFCKKWHFVFNNYVEGNIEPCGIKVMVDGEAVLFLRSDQFGFTAPHGLNKSIRPWNSKNNPYIKYLRESKDKDKFQNVGNWVWATRSIGGSFLWPVKKCSGVWKSQYNIYRGLQSYIEDRVDLTLFEIKHYYDFKKENKECDIENYKYKSDKLYTTELSKTDSAMKMWLDHFESFEEYIEYFMFDCFVVDENDAYEVKNIITSEKIQNGYVQNIKNKNGEIKNLEIEEIEIMLENVAEASKCRSSKITDFLLLGSQSEND